MFSSYSMRYLVNIQTQESGNERSNLRVVIDTSQNVSYRTLFLESMQRRVDCLAGSELTEIFFGKRPTFTVALYYYTSAAPPAKCS